MIAACARGGTGCGGAEQTSAVLAAGSKAAAIAVPPESQDAFERAWLDAEFLALGKDLEGHESTVPPLDFGDCAGASAKHCLGKRIGHRYDSTWTRAEVRDTAVLLLVFHARADSDEDNELVVFRGRLVSKEGEPLKLDVVSREVTKVSDAVGTALGRRAVTPDVKDGNILWGIRFEPLSPKAFSLVDSLPDAWVQQVKGPNNEEEVFAGVPGNRGRWFILKEPKLRMAWLSWSERDGRLEPLREVTKSWSTYHLGAHRLRWNAEPRSVGYLALGGREGEGEPYLPDSGEVGRLSTHSGVPSPEESPEESPKEPWTDEELSWPQAVRRHLVHCTSRSAQELKPGLYEARCGCGNPCGYSTFVDVKGGRTSSAFWLPLGVDARRERVAVSTEASMPIRIVGMFDEREWKVIRRPAGDAMELSHIVEATFTGDRLHLKYRDRRWEEVEEVVALPRQVPRPRPEDSRVLVQGPDKPPLDAPAEQAQAPAGGQVFIQGSEVNLRDNPATSAKVVGKVAIGTECLQVKAAAKQWVRIRCGEVEGFTLKALVGVEKPTVEALLAQAGDAALEVRVRLDAATRAATLAPENEQALKLLSERFFDVNFDQLKKDQRKGGLHEKSLVMRQVTQDVPIVKRETGREGVVRELEKIEYDWHRIEFRGNAFVSAMYRGGALVVYTGAFASMRGMFNLEIEDRDEEFLVSIESRSSSPVSEVLQRALRQDARTPTPEEVKYSELHQESPDMLALSGESLRLYRSLPARWYTLSKSGTGGYLIDMRCGLWGVDLRMDLHRRASIWWRRFEGQGEATDAVTRVVSVSKTTTGYQFQLRYRSGLQKTLTLSWPTSVANVARWDLAPHGDTQYYAVANARNIPADDSECQLE